MKFHQIILLRPPPGYKAVYPAAVLKYHLSNLVALLSSETSPYYVDVESWCPTIDGHRYNYTYTARELEYTLLEHMLPYRITDIWPITTKEVDKSVVCTRLRLVLRDVALNDLFKR
jgi:hypothetical protein